MNPDTCLHNRIADFGRKAAAFLDEGRGTLKRKRRTSALLKITARTREVTLPCGRGSVTVRRRRGTLSKVLLAGLAAAAIALAFDGDTFAQKFDSLPQAVKETAKAHMGDAFPVSIGAAQGEQGWNYQINTRLNGKYHDLVIDDKGKLVAVKDETDFASLPAPAQAAIQKQGDASKIVTLEKVTEGGQVSYGAVIKDAAQGTSVQVRVAADGTLKSKNQNEHVR